MDTYQLGKAKVRRVVGFVDGVLTVALIFHIICYTIYPLFQEHEEYGLKSDLRTGNTKELEEPLIEKWWIWPVLALCGVCSTVPVLAAVALVISTSPSITGERPLELTRFWMHCNTFSIVMAVMEFVIVLLIHLSGSRIGIPIPTLFYLACRAIFTIIIWRQLDTMRPTLIATMDADFMEEKREANHLPMSTMQSRANYPPIEPGLPLRSCYVLDIPEPESQCVGSQTD